MPLSNLNRAPGADAFPLQAARACLAAPVLVFAICFGIYLLRLGHPSAPERLMILALDLLALGGIVAGVVLGIVAMALAPAGQRVSVFARAGAGLLLMALLIAIVVSGFIHARALAQQNRQALQQVEAATTNLHSQALAALHDPKKHQVDLAGFEDSLNRAADQSHGSEAITLRATSSYVAELQSNRSSYDQALRELTSAKVLAVTNLLQRDQIQGRKAVVEKFLEANQKLKTFVAQGNSELQKILVDSGVSSDVVQSAAAGFDKKFMPQAPFLTKIRDTDERMGQAMLGILDLLDTRWGRWRYDRSTRKVRFDDQAALQSYNGFMASIRQARTEQAEAQNGLAAVLSAGAPAQQAQQ